MDVNVRLDDYELRRGDETIYVSVTADRVEIDWEASGAHAVDPEVHVVCSNCQHAVTVTDDERRAIEVAVRAAAEEEAMAAAEASWEP